MFEGRTIINNNNNTITTNNDKIVKCCALESNKQVTDSLRSEMAGLSPSASPDTPLALPQVSSERVLAASDTVQNLINDSTLPPNWDFIKIDLFDNATPEELAKNKNKFKISINIKKSGTKDWITFRAGLNTPLRNMKRGLDQATWEGEHYQNVRDNYAELKQEFDLVRASKVYEMNYRVKGRTVENLSVVIAQTEKLGIYVVNLLFNDLQWTWLMRGDKGYLTPAQRKKNIISTVSIKPGNKIQNLKASDLLG
jgi:hypothetical protein